ncbi:hypothetical protein [Paenibacillus typhae]
MRRSAVASPCDGTELWDESRTELWGESRTELWAKTSCQALRTVW